MTLFDKYGGFGTVNTIVRQFYKDVLDSEGLGPYFEHVNMEGLIDHQTKFLCHVLGGPVEYQGRTLKAAHRNLRVTQAAFAEVADILQEALEDGGMDDADVQTVMSIVAETVSDIVTVE